MDPDTQVCKLKNLYEQVMLLFEQLIVQNKAVIDSFVHFEPIYRLLHVKSLISFLIPYRERVSLQASEWYGIKNK